MKANIKRVSLIIIVSTFALLLCCNWHRVVIKRGTPVDSFNGVEVYHNGATWNSDGRTVCNGYNIGLKYQCVEFVKRYYYEHYNHKMPNEYGNAIDFFQEGLAHGRLNRDRGLVQYYNGGDEKPQVGDIIIFDATLFNRYGHVAIISQVTDDTVEIIQQNYGHILRSRISIALLHQNDGWRVKNDRVLGWLRK